MEGSPARKMANLTISPVPQCQPPSNDDKEERNKKLCSLVFGIDLLRDKILNYAIHDNNCISRNDAKNCSLVQYSWLESVRKCLKRSGFALAQLNLWYDSESPPDCAMNRHFVESLPSLSRILETVPTFALKVIIYGCGSLENCKNMLQEIIRVHGSGLVTVRLIFHTKYFEMQMVEHGPGLQIMDISFIDITESSGQAVVWSNIASFSESMSLGRRSETKLRLAGKSGMECGGASAAFETVSFPATITTLELDRKMEQLMMNYELPKLAELDLDITTASADTLCQILSRVRLTLKKLVLREPSYGQELFQNGKIMFPIMGHLEFISMPAMYWASANGADLDSCLPVLKEITMDSLTPPKLRSLVQNNRFESVEKITFYIIDVITAESQQHLTLSLRQLPRVFPKVAELHIFTYVRYDTPHIFQPIFQNMAHLKNLHLTMCAMADTGTIHPRDFWNVMFLGMLAEEITADSSPDITRLPELCRLYLHYVHADAQFTSNTTPETGKLPDAVFELGFLRMPKLRSMFLDGQIEASKEMVQKFRSMGGNLMGCNYRT